MKQNMNTIHEHYQGFHQWNFTEENGEFIIWNRDININISDALRNIADVNVTTKTIEGGRRLIDVAINKKIAENILYKRTVSQYFLDKALLNKLINLILERNAQKNKSDKLKNIEYIIFPQNSLQRKIVRYIIKFFKK